MDYTRDTLEKMAVKELLSIAKELQIVGRHDMRKVQLIDAIVSKNSTNCTIEKEAVVEGSTIKEMKPKQDYIDNAKIGRIVAFTVNDRKTLSGMIEEIHISEFVVVTKSGVRFRVRKKNIVWVKTGDRWPKGVYLALKGEASNERKGPHKAQ